MPFLLLKNHEDSEIVIPIEIISEKQVFNRKVLLVTPRDGAGAWWVNADRVTGIESEAK